MAHSKFPKSRTRDLLFREVDRELLIHDPEAGHTFCLDRPAASILKHCDGGTSVEALLRVVREGRRVVSRRVALGGTQELKQRRLLEPGSLASTPFDGLSRRAMLRRLGIAAATAPLIVAVAANPVSAQSGAPSCQPADNAGRDSAPGCACTGTFDCCGICTINGCSGPPAEQAVPTRAPHRHVSLD